MKKYFLALLFIGNTVSFCGGSFSIQPTEEGYYKLVMKNVNSPHMARVAAGGVLCGIGASGLLINVFDAYHKITNSKQIPNNKSNNRESPSTTTSQENYRSTSHLIITSLADLALTTLGCILLKDLYDESTNK